MNSKYTLLAIISLVTSGVTAQVTVSPHSRMMFQKASFGFVSELPPAPARTVGSSYYADDYYTADIFLKGETKLEGVSVRLELKTNNLEILHEGNVKVLPGDRVLSFQWTTLQGVREVFIRANHITTEGLKLNGFLKLKTETEPYSLVEYYSTETLSPNYNAALDVGSRDNQIIKKSRAFIAKENLLLEVKGNKKKFLNDFKTSFQTDVSGIVKELDIDTKNENELIVLLKQLNYADPG